MASAKYPEKPLPGPTWGQKRKALEAINNPNGPSFDKAQRPIPKAPALSMLLNPAQQPKKSTIVFGENPPPSFHAHKKPASDTTTQNSTRQASSSNAAASQPSLVQTNLFQLGATRNGVAATHEKLKSDLQKVSGQMERRREEIDSRMGHETTGYVPSINSHGLAGDTGVAAGGSPMTAQAQSIYDKKIKQLEDRVQELERLHSEESKWARSMCRFLYDANEKSLASLRDVFSAVETLQLTSSLLLDGGKP